MKTPDVTLVLVEDDDIDAESVQRALRRATIANPLVRARDGIEALELLRGGEGRAALTPPYLLLVDLRLPRLDGLELIRTIRADAQLSRTVIFVLTTSDREKDKLQAYGWNVAGYIVKGDTGADFQQLMQLLQYYLLIVSPAQNLSQ
jgi:CheY-like chemotaxis protein